MGSNTARENAEAWLNEIEALTDIESLDAGQVSAARALVGSTGFTVLAGLLLGERNGLLHTLGILNPIDPAQQHSLMVTQGRIKGLDSIRQTLLQLFPETSPEDEGKDQ